jgi:hypothetical protein
LYAPKPLEPAVFALQKTGTRRQYRPENGRLEGFRGIQSVRGINKRVEEYL